MAAGENQRLTYRDKFRSLHGESFQSWFEQLVRALHPSGDFQAIRNTSGDGGLDGFAINSQLVYQVYAPARMTELRDSETAAKISADFAKAQRTLGGTLREWVFLHNHPEAKIGQMSAEVLSSLKSANTDITIGVLDIDSLWSRLASLPDTILREYFGATARSELYVKLSRANEHNLAHEQSKAVELYKEVLVAASGPDQVNDRVTALLGLSAIAANRRDEGEAEKQLLEAERHVDKLTDDGLRIHIFRLRANLMNDRRDDAGAEAAYRAALTASTDVTDDYVQEAILTTKVDLALLYCRTKRYELAEPLIRECEAAVTTLATKHDDLLIEHVMDASLSHALCTGDQKALLRGIQTLEEQANTHQFTDRFAHLLQRLGTRAGYLKAYDLGVLCCNAAVHLAGRAKRDDLIIAAEHTAAVLLYEKGDLDAAKTTCQLLLDHVRLGKDRVLHIGVVQLFSAIAHKLGDYDLSIAASEEAVKAAGDDLQAAVMTRHGLAQSLCDAGRVAEGLEHASATYALAKKLELPHEFLAELLFLTAHAACLLGNWATTDDALAQLGALSEWSENFEERRKNLLKRIEACRELRRRYEVMASDPSPLATAGTHDATSLHAANVNVITPLLHWWMEAPGEDVPTSYQSLPETRQPKNLAVLYDYWGRGNMSRLLLNLRGFPHSLNLVLEVKTLDEVRQAIRMFALFTDVLLLLWKGPTWSSRVAMIAPAFNGVEGGGGYSIMPTDPKYFKRQTPKSGTWYPAVGYGSFLPDEIVTFLATEALPLLRQGRLLIIPSSGVGCVYDGHGPFESLLAEICSATPVLRSDHSPSEFPLGWIPYFPEAPLAALADVIGEQPMPLRRLQSLLLRRTRELKDHREHTAAIRELELEIIDGLAELKDHHLRFKRKAGWEVADEPMASSAVTFNREDILGAAWQNHSGAGLYAHGRPDDAIAGAEWMPVLTLQNLGYRWRVTSTAQPRRAQARQQDSGKGEAVGAWLVPPGQDVQVVFRRRKVQQAPPA